MNYSVNISEMDLEWDDEGEKLLSENSGDLDLEMFQCSILDETCGNNDSFQNDPRFGELSPDSPRSDNITEINTSF